MKYINGKMKLILVLLLIVVMAVMAIIFIQVLTGYEVTAPIDNKLKNNISTEPTTEYIDLEDGKIEKAYLVRAIYPRLLMDGMPMEELKNIKLSDDFDGDGLTLLQEYEYDTNPFVKDTDEDGLDENDEVNLYGTNPINWDTDHDEMSDGTEINSGLDPLVKDSDDDGIFDNNEVVNQSVRLDSYYTYDLSEVGTLPSMMLTGKGDFSRELSTKAIEFLNIYCLVGTPYEFKYDNELTFDHGTLTFTISNDILANNQLQNLAIASYNRELNTIELLYTTYNSENQTITANITNFNTYMVISISKYLYGTD